MRLLLADHSLLFPPKVHFHIPLNFPKSSNKLGGKFQDKVVMITGASSGIGLETARKFAANRARVLLVARSAETLREVVEVIRKHGGEPTPFPAT